jgi:hypothetical protein
VLRRTDKAPELAWVLPVIQVVWINVHGLFVLGPLIMGAYLIDHLSRAMYQRASNGPQESPGGQSWWKHIGGAAACVGAACLANPYGLRGALLPLELFPKITAWGGLYKSYIAEFMDLQAFVQKQGLAAAGNLFIRAECFLFWVVPLSFLVPAMWRAAAKRAGGTSPVHAMAWCGGFSLAVGLILACVLGFPGWWRRLATSRSRDCDIRSLWPRPCCSRASRPWPHRPSNNDESGPLRAFLNCVVSGDLV